MTYYNIIASTYGSNNYNQYDYNGANATTTGTGAGSSGGSALVDTGIAVAGVVAIAATVLLFAVVVRVWKRKKAPRVADAQAE